MTAETRTVRSQAQRKHDVLERLEREEDIWVASAALSGTPYLVPLSFLWDGEAVWLSTRAGNPTGRNLRATGLVRMSLAHTRDVVLLDGRVTEVVAPQDMPEETGDAFAAKSRWDPRSARDTPSYMYFKVLLTGVQAWHEEHEIHERHLMRNGVWSV
ncbi:pyridoxamine 5'-phosphate oxidase family protein [Streptomyces pactum]|uniref:Pyridoxamine 5'-phosphate oxidase family protein n=1 Tax=Streptomyces pactum TaxID=68249 RepID=A0ABS0NI06_9ACTN|nr:pyridoxamine 5'-phosphate oxidase family protein [Streptomyces pactum]MBH5334801.1 pyridoxamine 5'-phosphate oxidase family protein [Streptomyces pactum]